MLVTYKLQLELTEPVGPNSWMAVSIRPVSQSTKRMKVPRMTMLGSSCRWEVRMRITRRKARAREETVTS